MTVVNFFSPGYDPEVKLTYSVISACYMDQWMFVRHQKRTTYEIAGGHIEAGETSDEAASRELSEETGAIKFNINRIATYSVKKNGVTEWGRLYYADVIEKGPIPDISEIDEVVLFDNIPDNLTHPDIQPHLFRETLDYLSTGL